MVRYSLWFLCKYMSPFHQKQTWLFMSKKKKKPQQTNRMWLLMAGCLLWIYESRSCLAEGHDDGSLIVHSNSQFQNHSVVVVVGRRRLRVKATECEDPAVARGIRMTFHCTCFVCVKPHLRQRLKKKKDAVLCSSFISRFPPWNHTVFDIKLLFAVLLLLLLLFGFAQERDGFRF